MSTVFLNNEFMPLEEAKISPLDRGFLFADGIYEVLPAFGGKLFRLEEHLVRLQKSLDAIRLDNPYSNEQWANIFSELMEQNGGGELAIYLQITRGAPQKRDHGFPDQEPTPTVFAMANPMAASSTHDFDNAVGASAITLDDIRWLRCDIKSISLLPNILLRQQAVEQDAMEAILLRDGYVTEGAASNVFIVKDGVIKTPPKNHTILGGITRDVIVEIAQNNQLKIEEVEIPEAELHQADEIWCSSATREILPVVTLNNRTVGDGQVGPVWKTMAKLYVNFKAELSS